MVPTLAAALRQIREDLAAVLSPDTLRSLCEQAGHTWRERILDPVTTIHLFVLQILHRNTAAAHLPRLTGRTFSPSAYCQARARLPLAVLRELVSRVAAGWPHASSRGARSRRPPNRSSSGTCPRRSRRHVP